MYNSFLSIVGVINQEEELEQLPEYLLNLYSQVEKAFSDFEFILVNNTYRRNFLEQLAHLPAALRQHVHLLNLSSPVDSNNAIIAGLDRSNGDYTLLFEPQFAQTPELAKQLFDKTQEGFDIVYLRASQRREDFRFRPFYKLFYSILKNYSDLEIDEKAHDTRILSRRALNGMLRLRENLKYLKAIYSMVGYRTAHLEVDQPIKRNEGIRFSERFRTSLVAITSFTTFLRSVLFWIFVFSFLFLLGVIGNAVLVKLTHTDIFGNYHETLSGGWTFLVVLISIFFAVTCLNLYVMSIYLSNIYTEIKQRPLYIIESIQRL